MRVTEIASMRARAGHGEAFEDALVQCADVLMKANGCSDAIVMRCLEDTEAFTLLIDWESVEAHAEFTKSSSQSDFVRLVRDHISPQVESAHFKRVS